MKKDIEAISEKVDTVIVSCHWGVEFMNKPSPYVVALGRKMIDWGVDIVLGHHSHVMQGIEHYNNGLIAYSLGNFLFDMLWDQRLRESFIVIFHIGNKLTYELVPVTVEQNYSITMNPDTQGRARYFDKLCEFIQEYPRTWDRERMALKYYSEYQALLRENRLKTYRYFIRNLHKYDKKFLFQVISRTLKRWVGRLT